MTTTKKPHWVTIHKLIRDSKEGITTIELAKHFGVPRSDEDFRHALSIIDKRSDIIRAVYADGDTGQVCLLYREATPKATVRDLVAGSDEPVT